jgi:orotate phosphoribosyltransferase
MIADTGAILEGKFFFALKSGKVSAKYVNLDATFVHPFVVDALAAQLVRPWRNKFDVLAVPAVGGIPILYCAALDMSDMRIETVWADKRKDDSFAFERMGFAKAVRSKRVLVLEDIESTGGTTIAVCDLSRKAGGDVIGVSCIWNRGDVTAETFGVPEFRALITEKIEMWDPGEHEQWGAWPLVEDVGHPERFPDYPGPRVKLLA